MRRFTKVLCTFLSVLVVFTVSPIIAPSTIKAAELLETDIPVSKAYFPDDGFRREVSYLDESDDGILSLEEREAVTKLTLKCSEESEWNFYSLEGIEYFPNLEKFVADRIKVKEIDFSSNTKLKHIEIYRSDLEVINLGDITSLETLYCSSCHLKSIDLSNQAELRSLGVSENDLTSIDVSKNPLLDVVGISNNNIKTLDLSNNYSLTYIYADNCGLESITFTDSDNKFIRGISVYNNNLTSLDLSGMNTLLRLNCSKNKLTTLDVGNSILADGIRAYGNNIDCITFEKSQRLTYLLHMPNLVPEIVKESYLVEEHYVEEIPDDSFDIAWFYSGIMLDSFTSISNGIDTYEGDKTAKRPDWSNPVIKDEPADTTPSTPVVTEPVVTPTQTPVVTTIPTVVPTVAPTAEPGLGGFIERLYNVALERDSEAAGKDYWMDQVKYSGMTGSDVAKGFLTSNEFLNKSMSNEKFVKTLYETFFDREPDEAGFTYWLNELNGSKTKTDVIDGFCNSTEWANLCLTYGIPSGSSATPTITIEPNDNTKAFVNRLYTMCLSRAAEEEGFNYWTNELSNMRMSGSEVARGFYMSNEFKSKNVTNEEYVKSLYNVILGREPESAGLNYWLGLLNNGVSRGNILNGFFESLEWANICSNYAILK